MRRAILGALAILAGTFAIARAATRPHECTSWGTRVDGVVIDREGHGVAGAFVVARPVDGGARDPLAGGVQTDRTGHFRIEGLPPGDYAFVSLVRGAIATTPEMPVADRLIVSISLTAEATKI